MNADSPRRSVELDANRRLWDRWTEVHQSSRLYDIDGFLAGGSSLNPVELEELGDVAGRKFLHLQCHFGLDTLSWARRGADVTGVDLSPKAVERARELTRQAELEARFLCADVYDLDQVLGPDERFDIVHTSYGALCWLHDLDAWARLVARRLKPDGIFHLVEFHPLLETFGEDGRPFAYPYFGDGQALSLQEQGSYADPDAEVDLPSYVWPHALGEVVSALLLAGLRLEHLHEHAESPFDCYPFTAEIAPGRAVVPGFEGRLPMLFSVLARRPAER